jgi:hypothetical protein
VQCPKNQILIFFQIENAILFLKSQQLEGIEALRASNA